MEEMNLSQEEMKSSIEELEAKVSEQEATIKDLTNKNAKLKESSDLYSKLWGEANCKIEILNTQIKAVITLMSNIK